MRQYKVLLPLKVHTEDGSYEQDEVFSKDFSEEDEVENLSSGLLELQPLKYRALTDNLTFAPQGEEFEAPLLKGEEAALILGGHIEKLDEPEPEPAAPKKPRKKKVA